MYTIIKSFQTFSRLLLVLTAIGLCHGVSHADSFRLQDREARTAWEFYPAANFGYHKLLNGYDGYEDLGKVGADLYIRFPRSLELASPTEDQIIARFSLDYFPLQTPKGANVKQEDVFAFTYGYVYSFRFSRFGREIPISPIVGLAGGVYHSRVTVDTPATGKAVGSTNHLGWMATAGIILPEVNIFGPVRFIPEIRYHSMRGLKSNATSITYQLGISYWPPSNPRPRRR